MPIDEMPTMRGGYDPGAPVYASPQDMKAQTAPPRPKPTGYDPSPPIQDPGMVPGSAIRARNRYDAAPPLDLPPAGLAIEEMPRSFGGYDPSPPIFGAPLPPGSEMVPDQSRAQAEEPTRSEFADKCAFDGWLFGMFGEAIPLDKLGVIELITGGPDNKTIEVCAHCGIDHPIRLSAHTGTDRRIAAEQERDRIMQAMSTYRQRKPTK